MPAGEDTKHLIGAAELGLMKPTSILVNTARGAIVDGVALAVALHDGTIGGAGLDVYENEPDVPESLLRAPRATLLPHIGSATHTARDAMARTAAENVLAVAQGVETPRTASPERTPTRLDRVLRGLGLEPGLGVGGAVFVGGAHALVVVGQHLVGLHRPRDPLARDARQHAGDLVDDTGAARHEHVELRVLERPHDLGRHVLGLADLHAA